MHTGVFLWIFCNFKENIFLAEHLQSSASENKMSSAHSISILILEKRRFMLTQIQKNIEGKYLVTRIVGSKKENNQIFA